MKKCAKCKNEKPEIEFSRDRSKTDGLQGLCKICHRQSVTASKILHQERYNTYQREYQKRPEVRAYQAEYQRNYSQKRKRAKTLANDAERSGKLPKQPCIICHKSPADKHHLNYSDPLSVIYLCHAHHQQLHAGRFSLIPK